MKETITPETCLKCGACCISPHDQPAFCDVTDKDMERLGKRLVRLHVLQSNQLDRLASILDGGYCPQGAIKTAWREQKTGPLKGFELCACSALRGSVLSKVSCSVYEKRPEVCRKAVKPGDRVCRIIRRAFKQQVEDADCDNSDS